MTQTWEMGDDPPNETWEMGDGHKKVGRRKIHELGDGICRNKSWEMGNGSCSWEMQNLKLGDGRWGKKVGRW